MRPARSPFALSLLVALCALPSRAERPKAAEARPGAMVLEVVGGATLGLAGGWAGAMIGYSAGGCHEDEEYFCGDKLAGGFLGAWIGNAIGNTVGITLAGNAFDQGGSTGSALVAGLVGNLVSIPIVASLSDKSPGAVLAALVLVPAMAGTLGYQAGVSDHIRQLEESETSLRMRDGALRLAAAPPMAGLLQEGFRADLITIRF